MLKGRKMTRFEGGCRCGAVRYEFNLELPLRGYACHCLDCQTWTGSAFSQQIVITDHSLSASGETGCYEWHSPSGRLSNQYYCPKCQTRIYNTNSARPGIALVRAGTLDKSNELVVVAHIWVRRMQPWLRIHDDVATWEESPPLADLASVLAGHDA